MQSPRQDLALNGAHKLLSSGLPTHTTDVLTQEFAGKEEHILTFAAKPSVSVGLSSEEEMWADRFCPTDFPSKGTSACMGLGVQGHHNPCRSGLGDRLASRHL